jgi:hypothetical protein
MSWNGDVDDLMKACVIQPSNYLKFSLALVKEIRVNDPPPKRKRRRAPSCPFNPPSYAQFPLFATGVLQPARVLPS